MEQLDNIERKLDEYKLDQGGLVLLKRFLVSGPGCEFQPDLINLRGPAPLSEIHALNPTGSAITLFSWAQEQDVKPELGSREVILAFASEGHARASWEAINSPFFRKIRADEGFDQIGDRKESYLFTDLANPIEIKSAKGQRVEGIYYNGGIEIQIKNIFSQDELKQGDWALIHLGSVVHRFQPSEDLLISEIQRLQRKSADISGHYEKIDRSVIDYDSDFGASIFDFNQNRCEELNPD